MTIRRNPVAFLHELEAPDLSTNCELTAEGSQIVSEADCFSDR